MSPWKKSRLFPSGWSSYSSPNPSTCNAAGGGGGGLETRNRHPPSSSVRRNGTHCEEVAGRGEPGDGEADLLLRRGVALEERHRLAAVEPVVEVGLSGLQGHRTGGRARSKKSAVR